MRSAYARQQHKNKTTWELWTLPCDGEQSYLLSRTTYVLPTAWVELFNNGKACLATRRQEWS